LAKTIATWQKLAAEAGTLKVQAPSGTLKPPVC